MYLLLSHNMVELLVFMIIYHYWDGPTNGKLFTFIKIYKKKTIPSISIPQGGRGGCGGFTHLGEMRRWSKISKHDHSIIKRQEREDGGIFFLLKEKLEIQLFAMIIVIYSTPCIFHPHRIQGRPAALSVCKYMSKYEYNVYVHDGDVTQLYMDNIQLPSIPFYTLCAPSCFICVPPCTFVCRSVPLA